MKNFAGKVAFITGGANGIGFGMVRTFLGEGMRVVVADFDDGHLANAREQLSGNNAVHFVKVDVADRAQLRAAADEAIATFGKIHVLCNNAGVAFGGGADDPEFEQWDRAIAINFGGVVNGSKIIAPIIKAQGEGGHIVNTSSMAGMVPLPGMGAYAATKYAVRGFTESLRMALAPDGIGVSCLYPGAVLTGMLSIPKEEDDLDDLTGGVGGRELKRALGDAARAAMDPLEMGRRVLEGIRENRAHILTHPEFLDEVKARHRAIEEGFPTGETIAEGRTRFEAMRWQASDELLGMDAKD